MTLRRDLAVHTPHWEAAGGPGQAASCPEQTQHRDLSTFGARTELRNP